MTAMVLVALIALALVVLCNVAWLLVWSRRRDHSGPSRVQVAGDNSTQISGTNITITAVNGSLAAHTIDGAVTIGQGQASTSPLRAGITRDGRCWEQAPACACGSEACRGHPSTIHPALVTNLYAKSLQEALARGPNGLAKSDTIRPQTPWERQLAEQQEGAPHLDDRPELAAILAGLYRVQSIAATLKMGPAVQHVGELPAGLTLKDKNTLFYDETGRCGYLWTGTRFVIEGAEARPEQPAPPEFLLGYASPIPVREFKATCSCPRCGWVDAHYLHTMDLPEGATIGRECTNCKMQWGEK